MCERFVEFQHLEELVSIDQMDITVGEGADVDRGLTNLRVPPERISEDVTFA